MRLLRLADAVTDYETSEQERIDLATAVFLLMLAHARGESIDPALAAKLEARGVTEDQLDAAAETVSREAAAKMFGLRWNGSEFVDDPQGRSVTETTDAAVNRTVAKADEEGWDEDELLTTLAALTVFSAGRVDMIMDDQLTDLESAMQLEAMAAAGVEQVDVIDDNGPNSCEECMAVDGARWSIEFARANKKEHPHCVREFVAVWPRALRQAAEDQR